MKRLLIISLLLLSGCVTTVRPVAMQWPAVPGELEQPAPELTPLGPEERSLSQLLINADNNYSQYYILKQKYEAWQKWYQTQKNIYEQAE